MILVTGATGHFGNATIDFLLAKGVQPSRISALGRKEASADQFTKKGVGFVLGDYDNYPSLVAAFKGVEKLLFVSGSDIANRLAQHRNVVTAAKAAGVKHIVYTSFQGKNETESSPLWVVAQSHLQTEAWLKESGIDYTILKNTLYMDFVPAFLGEKVIETGTIYLPAGEGKVGAVLRSEMAEATASILAGTGHEGKTYRFTHTEAFSYPEVAGHLTQITGRTISYVSPTADAYARTLASYGVPDDFIGVFSGFAIAQAEGELDAVGSDLEQLLGRTPTTVRAFLEHVYSPSNHS
jgi:NAD(P)H dehydrogenase (quinone)